ncbi:murein biosynthesis integral membrane protein MurJ [Rhodococcus sp. WMMA185]|uniref:murein biosynthesis integral membrane protein MurJ n=1 Tax=Rhodococcus sp. WMMA185 TaxID=679318 RepID=UPI00087B2194|nr:murein biosynthesis integral membrane protein MurJ [Rhodococcus sp. WMMA185]AOW93921.1 murein biosynthesis integral membrane protein MurJ [Rhodococcus sp. WMMA185]
MTGDIPGGNQRLPDHSRPRVTRTRIAPWERDQQWAREIRPDEAPTVQFAAIRVDQPPPADDSGPSTAPQEQANSRLLASTGSIAIATLVSRITGFVKQLLVLTLLGASLASSFTVASQIPNMIAELVLGAVLTAIVVPVLVRAEREDSDGGAAFVRRLFTATCILLGTAALLATAAAPLITRIFVSDDARVSNSLTTALTYLLLPAILFYGLSALLTAILNTRQVFKPGAWAPVLNNVVMITVLVIYYVTPGEITIDPVRMGDPKLLVLGIGVTLGVVVQAASLVPAIRRERISLKPLLGLDDRLRQFGGMAVAIILYVLISQAGMAVATHISSQVDEAGPAIYTNAWLLLQLPYGVLGVTVLTAIMPRLSRNAADDDTPAVVDDLSVATRLTMIALIPITIFLTLAGQDIGHALYAYGNFGAGDAGRLGEAVSWSAFTLIPYSLVLIQLRVFYARERAWTPTWIVLGITAVKIALSALTPFIASSDDQVVILLGAANGLGYVVGALIGGYLLHRSLGNLQMANVGKTVWVVVLASLAGAAAVLGTNKLLNLDRLATLFGGPGSMVLVIINGILMLAITFAILWFAKIPEILSITVAVRRKVRALRGRGGEAESEADSLADADTELIPAIRDESDHSRRQPLGSKSPNGLPYPGHERIGSPPGTGRSRAFDSEGVRVSDDDVAGSNRAGGSVVQAAESGSAAAPDSPAASAKERADTPTFTGGKPKTQQDGMPKTGQIKDTGDREDSSADPKTEQGTASGDADQGGDGNRDVGHIGTAPGRDISTAPGRDISTAPGRDNSVDTGVIPITPAPDREPATKSRPTPRGPKLIPGASVAGGRYRLLTPHGGSRGLQFWQALDVKLDREVALTFVDAEQRSAPNAPDGPQAILSRTLRLGRINSPGLARVLDVVRGSSGGIVVAEWTPGRSLREMADTKPSPIGAASAIRSLAAAAETAHRAGGALSIDHPDRVRISINGDAVLAFPATLADSDSSSDVRGLGAMLYALITARWPLTDQSAPAGAPRPGSVGGMRLADRDTSGQPIGPRVIRPEVPFEISAVTLRSLEPNGGIRTAATVQHILDQASVVNEKTEFIPALRLGQRNAADSEHALADPEAIEAEKKRSNRMIAALAGLAVVTIVVLALLGFWLATFLTGSSSDAPLTEQSFGLTSTAAPAPTAETNAGSPTAPSAGVAPVTPAGISVFSPQGTPDSEESAPLAIDGDSSTMWSTDNYFQPFPALKNGVGLMVTFDQPINLASVSIDSPTPGTDVEIRSAPSADPSLDQTRVLGSAVLEDGVTDIPVTSAGPTSNVLVWISGLSSEDGRNQSSIANMEFDAAN